MAGILGGLIDGIGLQNSLGSAGLLGKLHDAYGGEDRLRGLLLTLGGHDQAGALLMQQAAQREAGDRFGREFGSIYGGGQPQQASPAAAPVGLPIAPRAASTTGKIYGNDEPSPLDPPSGQDRDLTIRTMLAEAGNQGSAGLNAVGSVIRNRAVAGNFGGDTPTGVVQAPNQFEPWNTAGGRANMAAIDPNSPRYQQADQALTSAYAGNDPTMGATHFFAPKAQAALGRDVPSWGRSGGQDIGDHRFFGGAAGQQQVASADGAVPQGRTTDITAGQQPMQMAQAAPQQSGPSQRAMQIMRALQIPNLPEGQRKIGEMLLQQELQASSQKPTSDITEYERAQKDPAFRQYLIDMKKAGKPETTVNVGGGSDKQVFDAMLESTNTARSAAVGLQGLEEARKAIQAGAITGFGANQQLGAQKLLAKALGYDDTRVINSETFRSAIAPQVAAVLKATVGTANISNTDREFALQAAGGTITLDEKSILRVLDIMERASRAQIKQHNERINKVYPDAEKFSRERAIFSIDEPSAPSAPQMPQVPEPRQAPDGNMYIPDPNRPGKYLRVVQ